MTESGLMPGVGNVLGFADWSLGIDTPNSKGWFDTHRLDCAPASENYGAARDPAGAQHRGADDLRRGGRGVCHPRACGLANMSAAI